MSGIAIGLFFALGLVLSLVGSIWGLVQAFQEEVVWGVLYLVVPFAGFVFYAKKWGNLKIRKTFLIQCAGWLMIVLGSITTAIFAPAPSPNVDPGSNEQSPSAFPSDSNTSPSPKLSPAPKPKPSP
ncbi:MULTISPECIES: hypothetical protein [unclassified Microcoleus]|uniref:hypothetical protein n=1 Tax=unclassified Microcoleus TaxID=2642155 RepID=UPI0025EF9CED|nr:MULTISPECIES: hypothetical protein [unclassified Microcoleus]